jgi:hypothetical protein
MNVDCHGCKVKFESNVAGNSRVICDAPPQAQSSTSLPDCLGEDPGITFEPEVQCP